jgi:hypothetical protein
MALSKGQWQDACIALEIVRSLPTGDSLASAVQIWARCIGMLDGKTDLVSAVRFFLAHYNGPGPANCFPGPGWIVNFMNMLTFAIDASEDRVIIRACSY